MDRYDINWYMPHQQFSTQKRNHRTEIIHKSQFQSVKPEIMKKSSDMEKISVKLPMQTPDTNIISAYYDHSMFLQSNNKLVLIILC